MTKSVFIDGAAGTTGLEIADRLAGRFEFNLITLGDDKRKDPAAKREALNDADFVILCLPDDAAKEAVALFAEQLVMTTKELERANKLVEKKTISVEEFDNARKQYFPQPGDSPEVIAQKRRNREITLDAMRRDAGPAYRPARWS